MSFRSCICRCELSRSVFLGSHFDRVKGVVSRVCVCVCQMLVIHRHSCSRPTLAVWVMCVCMRVRCWSLQRCSMHLSLPSMVEWVVCVSDVGLLAHALRGGWCVCVSDVGLLAHTFHAPHVAVHGGAVGDLAGAGRGEPASRSVTHALPMAPPCTTHSQSHFRLLTSQPITLQITHLTANHTLDYSAHSQSHFRLLTSQPITTSYTSDYQPHSQAK